MAVSEQERNDFIMSCLNDGMSLNDVQNRLVEEFDLHMTYMELRLLSSELQVSWEAQDRKAAAARPKSKPAPEAQRPAAPAAPEAAEEAEAGDMAPEENAGEAQADADGEADETNGTVVEVSKVQRPGCSMSGTVKFGSGASGEWFLDGYGRLGFQPDEGSTEPTQEDQRSFQAALYKALGY